VNRFAMSGPITAKSSTQSEAPGAVKRELVALQKTAKPRAVIVGESVAGLPLLLPANLRAVDTQQDDVAGSVVVGSAVDVVRMVRATQTNFAVLEYDVPATIATTPFLTKEHPFPHTLRTR
jgi:hypothetical protein